MLRALCLSLALVAPITATAEEPAWPEEFTPLIDAAKSYCDGEFSVFPEAAVQRDLNGDGAQDWLLDEGAFSCSTSTTLYCGTLGCGVDTLIDGKLASLTLFDWQMVEDNGKTLLRATTGKGTADLIWNADAGQWDQLDR